MDKLVAFDMLNSTRTSRGYRLTKVEVTLDLLESRPRYKSHQAHKCHMYEFGNKFFINPSVSKTHDALVERAVSFLKKKRILGRLQAEFGLFKHGRFFASIDSGPQAMTKMMPLLKRFEKENSDRLLMRQFLRLHCWEQLTPVQVCQRLGITQLRYRRLRRRLNADRSNPINQINRTRFEPLRLLASVARDIIRLMRRTSFRLKSLDNQYAYLAGKYRRLRRISAKAYARFVKQYLGFKFRTFTRTYSNPDRPRYKRLRKSMAYLLEHLADRDCLLVYFDSSPFSNSSFKNKIWSLSSRESVQVNEPKVQGYTSLLMATTNDRILNYWIVNRINSVMTASFLYETISYCRTVLKRERLVFFMDNARIHSTELLKRLARHQRVYFLLNTPLSSKLNQIEYVFEVIKRGYRNRRDKAKKRSLAKDVRDQMKDIEHIDLAHATRRFRKEVLKAILLFDMWKRAN